MKRLSLEYIDYLEAVTLSLLAERDFHIPIARLGVGGTYSPPEVKQRIADMRQQVATIKWAGEVEGHGFGICVPRSFACCSPPGTRVKIQEHWSIEVLENFSIAEGPCLILFNGFATVAERLIEAGMVVRID